MSPLDIEFSNIFSHSFSYLGIFLMVSSIVQKFEILIKYNLSSFSFIAHTFGVPPKKPRS